MARCEEIKIDQHHNVQSWTRELADFIDPDIILLNSMSVIGTDNIRMYNHNVIARNHPNERHAGVAIAIRENII